MKVFSVEAFGQIKVTDQGANPLSKVYVKCFKKSVNGKTSFYKDGYTDLRGSFDYASLNLDSLDDIKMFSLLIVGSQEINGAIIKEVNPPKSKVGKKVEARKLIGNSWKAKQNNNATNMASQKYAMF